MNKVRAEVKERGFLEEKGAQRMSAKVNGA